MLFAARIVDGLSGGNITTARAYIADITTEENRAKAYGLLGAAFGLGFIVGPALGAGVVTHQLHRADLGGGDHHAGRDRAGVVVAARNRAPCACGQWPVLARAAAPGPPPGLRRLLAIDFIYWMSFAVYQTTFALFGARRFGFDATHTGYLFSAFGAVGVVVQGGLVGPVVRRLGNRRTLVIGLVFTAVGWGGSALTYSVPLFVLLLVPGAIGIGLCNATLIALVSNAADRARAGPHPGGRRRARKPRPHAGAGLGQRAATEGRRRRRLRRRRRPAPGRRRPRRRGGQSRFRLPSRGTVPFRVSDADEHREPVHGRLRRGPALRRHDDTTTRGERRFSRATSRDLTSGQRLSQYQRSRRLALPLSTCAPGSLCDQAWQVLQSACPSPEWWRVPPEIREDCRCPLPRVTNVAVPFRAPLRALEAPRPGDQVVHLADDRFDRIRLAEIHAGLLQLLHRIVVAARPQQLEVAVPRGALRGRPAAGRSRARAAPLTRSRSRTGRRSTAS